MLTFTLHHYCPLPDPLRVCGHCRPCISQASVMVTAFSMKRTSFLRLACFFLSLSNSAGIRFPAASVPGYRSTDIHNDVWHALIHSRTMALWIWGHEYGQGTVMQNGHSLCELWITFRSAVKECFRLLNPSTSVEGTNMLLPKLTRHNSN